MIKVKVLVLTGFGLNCDNETAHAFKLVGADVDRVHINDVISGEVNLKDYKILALGGGFSWGDDHGAGVLQAIRLKTHLGEDLIEFVLQGKLIIGICNGFQTLVNLGLLPGFNIKSLSRKVALLHNDGGSFIDDWVYLKSEKSSQCIFTHNLDHIELPIRHGEGKFYADTAILESLEKNNQIALRYCREDGTLPQGEFPFNPNGSLNDIAGICDATGRVFGLMPHPEAFCHWTNHPHWPLMHQRMRKAGESLFDSSLPQGMYIFKNAVDYFK